ncbi:MAG TPA: enoyl-CoA hydratase/isomerase family protein [Allosphingosinicella sp.]
MFRLGREGEIARLVLDRPQARNAIPANGWRELAALVDQVSRSDARLLVLSGSSGAFCAGADVGDFETFRRDEAARTRFRTDIRAALDGLRALPIPSVAQIEGACYGAGVALAIACDIRIATPSASFAVTPAKIGIAYPQQDVHRLVALVGPGQTARLLFTATTIDAAEAVRIGLAETHDADQAIAAMLANDADSLATLKRAVALAAEGVRSDAEQDRRFDALLGSDALARRLEALRRK